MLKENVKWPETRRFKSQTEWEPVGFFSDCLSNSTSFDLLLGFFSTSAFNVLSYGFSLFLYNGGKMRLVINNILTEQDKETILKGEGNDYIPEFNIHDLNNILLTLSEKGRHFFECVAWLIRHDRIEIKIIAPKGLNGISHTKQGLFSDGSNWVGFDGSCNFSKTALIDNIESISAFCDWDPGFAPATIKEIQTDFNRIFNEEDNQVLYLNAEDIKTEILSKFEDQSLNDLVKTEYKFMNEGVEFNFSSSVMNSLLNAKAKIEGIISEILEEEKQSHIANDPETYQYEPKLPEFPYPSGPRDYQKEAYERWKENNQRGLFAMATGTGKTITSLNCLLNIYKQKGEYKAIILVPTTVLVDQWELECKKFNFINTIKVYSKNKDWIGVVENLALKEKLNPQSKTSYILISTYASFTRNKIFKALIPFPKSKVLLIADEAHNMGAGRMKSLLSQIPYYRRIGLSATPERQFDESGNHAIRKFFGVEEKYTFEYDMEKAINEGRLCQYSYYPHVVYLTSEELFEYSKISAQIVKFYNYESESFTNNEQLTMLLLKRKRIIHKAVNKKSVFKQILENHIKETGSLKYTLIYAPEGNTPNDQLDDDYDECDTIIDDAKLGHIIDDYTRIVANLECKPTVMEFTSDTPNRDEVLKQFAEGKLNVLTSMKCLDEGVDVPRSELAIFCSSTGNPRQFIQRRGRILRTHKDKKCAIIHDLVVAPLIKPNSSSYKMERNLLNNEMSRVREFAKLSRNSSDTAKELDEILTYYNLPMFNS